MPSKFLLVCLIFDDSNLMSSSARITASYSSTNLESCNLFASSNRRSENAAILFIRDTSVWIIFFIPGLTTLITTSLLFSFSVAEYTCAIDAAAKGVGLKSLKIEIISQFISFSIISMACLSEK